MALSDLESQDGFLCLKQQYDQVFVPTTEPKHQASEARKFAEALCHQIFEREIGKKPDKFLELNEYFEIFKKHKLDLRYATPHFATIQTIGNYNSHYQGSSQPNVTTEYVQPALNAVDFLMNWYVHTQLQRPNFKFVQGKMTETPPDLGIVTESNNYELEMIGGAIPLNSNFYVIRDVDQEFTDALQRRDSIVLLKGSRQVGKTSLLARGIQRAREAGIQVILTDCQKLPLTQLETLDKFLLTVSSLLAKQLKLSVTPKSVWDFDCVPTLNFEGYFIDHILTATTQPILWAIDEADNLFNHKFSSELFALLRSWHNERALNPKNPCHRLTIAIAYATESYLFIKDQSQSPFNVGTKLMLNDFTLEQIGDLNRRYGNPLKSEVELQEFYQWVSGHPYLVRAGLNEIVKRSQSLTEFQQQAVRDEGVFGDHLRRIVMLLQRDTTGLATVTRNLFRHKCPDEDSFYRLRSAGVLRGESRNCFEFRCKVYEKYLHQHLM